jgi:hypothetical protein
MEQKDTDKKIRKFLKDHPEWKLTKEQCYEIIALLQKYGGLLMVELEAYVNDDD